METTRRLSAIVFLLAAIFATGIALARSPVIPVRGSDRELERALVSLLSARSALQSSPRDAGGNTSRALSSTNRAIDSVRAALRAREPALARP